jgi:poly-gamma-glutamate synthesis protein (capsule biosynthesis protein)
MKIPYNYVEKMPYSKKRRLLYHLVFKLADIFGFWRYPSDLNPDQWRKLVNDMYWCYKSAKPIVKPEKGSELDAYFVEKRRQIGRSLLPEGFQGEKSVIVSAVGDLMKPKGIENSGGKFYAKVAELIFDADISIANLESPPTIARIAKSRRTIHATREQFNVLKGHNGRQYTVFCVANNHILDRGLEGFNTAHDLLETEGFFYVGTNRSFEAQQKGLIVTVSGVKFGFVAATYSVNNQPFPNGKNYLVNLIPFHRFQGKVDVSLLEKQIAFCRSQDCDFIIVSLHWGLEFEFFPRQNQVDIAHHLIECGADAIISHHTHNIQPYEIYQTRRDPHRIAPIFYSLGNLSSVWSAPYHALSLVTSFDVIRGHVNGTPKTLVAHVNVTPVIQMMYDHKIAPYLQLENLRELIKSARSICRNASIDEAGRYADLVLGKSWRN